MITEKRFKVHSMIQGMEIGETMDLELCEELIKKYGSSSDIELFITNNGNNMTYQEVVDLLNENEQLKIFLRAVNEELDLTIRDYDTLEEENEQLQNQIDELKQDNDIKFWKHKWLHESNANSVLLFELGKAIDGGYEVSDKFKDFMNDLNKSIENEKKKLERFGLND